MVLSLLFRVLCCDGIDSVRIVSHVGLLELADGIENRGPKCQLVARDVLRAVELASVRPLETINAGLLLYTDFNYIHALLLSQLIILVFKLASI